MNQSVLEHNELRALRVKYYNQSWWTGLCLSTMHHMRLTLWGVAGLVPCFFKYRTRSSKSRILFGYIIWHFGSEVICCTYWEKYSKSSVARTTTQFRFGVSTYCLSFSYIPMVYPMRASDPTGTSLFEVYLAYFLEILLSLVKLRVKAGAIFLLEVNGLELSGPVGLWASYTRTLRRNESIYLQ